MENNEVWTIQALKEYYDKQFESLQLAVTKAENATEKRFEGVNEFRNTLSDQQRTFMPRSESEALFDSHNEKNDQMFKSLSDKLDLMGKKLDKIENMKAGGNVVWAYVLGAISLIAGIIAIAINIQKI